MLGEGGFGLVVKARHRATGEFVAVKGLLHHSDDSTEKPAATKVRGMLREVAFLAACRGHLSFVGLRDLLHDPDSRVRLQAAQALLRRPDSGDTPTAGDDPFAAFGAPS